MHTQSVSVNQRKSETQEDANTTEVLKEMTTTSVTMVQVEDEQVRESRASQTRKYACIVHSDETQDARSARLQQVREHAQIIWSKEAPETRAARLQQQREHALLVHFSEMLLFDYFLCRHKLLFTLLHRLLTNFLCTYDESRY